VAPAQSTIANQIGRPIRRLPAASPATIAKATRYSVGIPDGAIDAAIVRGNASTRLFAAVMAAEACIPPFLIRPRAAYNLTGPARGV
jgi:hypothetical protein